MNENVKRWENKLSSKLNKMDEAMNQTEKFVELTHTGTVSTE